MSKRILLVEDEGLICETLMDLLQPYGYTVKSAPEGNQALEAIKLYRPHLIISDVMMPGMDGIRFLSAIKTSPDWNDIPFIMLTAKKEMEDRIEGLKTGADAYIAKPFNFHELLLTVHNLLELKSNIIERSFIHQQEANEASNESSFITKLTEYLDIHVNDQQLNLEQTAIHFKMSSSGFKKKIKRLTSKSFQDFVREYRLNKSLEYLQTVRYNVTEVASKTGFKSTAHFSAAFKKHFGTSPSNI